MSHRPLTLKVVAEQPTCLGFARYRRRMLLFWIRKFLVGGIVSTLPPTRQFSVAMVRGMLEWTG